MQNSMNIFALGGHEVKYSFPKNGYPIDQEFAKKHLEQGEKYTVLRTEVSQSSTSVYLLEFPFLAFNSVLFEDVKPQLEEMDKMHPHYIVYRKPFKYVVESSIELEVTFEEKSYIGWKFK